MNVSELRNQLRPPCPALDVHVHPLHCFGPHKVKTPEEDARLLIETGARAGVAKMCIFSLCPGVPREPTMQECREANDYVQRLRDIAPDVFLPFCYVTPQFPNRQRRSTAVPGACGSRV